MATAKKAASAVKTPAGKTARKTAAAAKTNAPLKPIKEAFNKSTLAAHLSAVSSVEPKAVKAVLAALEATMLASVNKKGLGTFTLPGFRRCKCPPRRSVWASIPSPSRSARLQRSRRV
jgi:hypothetical protein